MAVATLTERLTLDQRTCGAFGRDQFIAAKAQAGGGDTFKRS